MSSSYTPQPTYVVLFDHEADHIRQLAIDFARQISAEILVARSHFSVLEFARQYKPAFCVIALEHLGDDIAEFPALVKEESAETQIVIIAETETSVESSRFDQQFAKVIQINS